MKVNRLEKEIFKQKHKKEQFIDAMRQSMSQINDETIKEENLEVFDTLLLFATYATTEDLEKAFQDCLPISDSNNTLEEMCAQLREINGFCNKSFSDDHQIYQALFNSTSFLTQERKEFIRTQLSKEITQMILDKTNTLEPAAAAGPSHG